MTSIATDGAITSATCTFPTVTAASTTFTIRLLINQVVQATTCSIAAGGTTCTISGSFPVITGDKIMLSAQRVGGTDRVSTVTAAAVESLTFETTLSAAHIVTGRVTTSASGVVTVTLTGGAAFTSASSYECTATDTLVGDPKKLGVNLLTGSTFSVGSETARVTTISYHCIGN